VHTLDVSLVCVAVLVVLVSIAILARQRYMLRTVGAIPLAIRVRGDRWVYGVARYVGGELRWYRALGVGTRPSRVLVRSQLRIVGHRPPEPNETRSMPASAVIVECRNGADSIVLAFGESAFTGFVSWVEASSPMS
jgi:hypothetical protein